jgi:hypothetical protein
MESNENMYICREHTIPFFHRGPSCPWCEFIRSVAEKLATEYKRGFFDGATAANKDRDREEKENVKRSNDRAQQMAADRPMPADIPKEQQVRVDPHHSE